MYRNVPRSFTKMNMKKERKQKSKHVQSGFHWWFFKWISCHFIFMFDSFVCIVRSKNVCKWTQCRKTKRKHNFHGSLCHHPHSRSMARKCVSFSILFVFRWRVIINASTRLFFLRLSFWMVKQTPWIWLRIWIGSACRRETIIKLGFFFCFGIWWKEHFGMWNVCVKKNEFQRKIKRIEPLLFYAFETYSTGSLIIINFYR